MNNDKLPEPSHDGYFTSEGTDLLEVREEDTKPGTVSESHRKRLREKYGKKEPPTNGPANDLPNGPAKDA